MPLRDATADDDRLRALLPRLWRFARSLAGDPAAADDLVQSALERALRGWDARRDDQALQAWLFSILYRRFIDEARRARRWQRLLGLLAASPPPLAPSPEQIHGERVLLGHFGELPAEHRAVLMLVAVEGFTYQQAADTLGIPIGTVMSRLSRARERLRALGEGQAPLAPALRRIK
ncbi:RNA polymerase sigma factor [Stenotrophomonas sp. HITSZ_GD]|uniref:RNA polymerase sigma factor n=1 Tax=Stenotrophomonas sp. HITSZ_GD TaxID=3037248 RepID=UPI00240D9E5F|nr:RNA polymerase sigma factor [Stenotrophomonas sp. HITSZ_GD]MDG2523768.1 RNA polymerase sigma factor [Stenotrophomonas sp. HITSZ_GD]